jgi:hypothetical protein
MQEYARGSPKKERKYRERDMLVAECEVLYGAV